MEFCNFIVKKGIGKNTKLDKEYRKYINDVIMMNDENLEERWEIYNLIIKNLFDIDNGVYFEEIKYRITDNENPNHVILDIISRYPVDRLNFIMTYLVKRVEEYSEEDFFKRFIE
jgi:hypothetical protein